MSTQPEMIQHDQIFVGGEFVHPSTSNQIEVISPNTEEVFGRVPDAGPADIDRAVAAARDAFDNGPFPRMKPEERSELLTRFSQAIQKRAQDLAHLISSQNGCPIQHSFPVQVMTASMVLDTYADIAKTYPFEETRAGSMGGQVLVRQHPVGVCAGILPWNVPMFIMSMKVGPALAAGCTMVLKAAPETPLDAYLLAEAVKEAGLPPGVINIVAAGREGSEYLVRHPDVDKVSFTGSSGTGSLVGSICGEQIKRCTLELGGKSAAVVLDDADYAKAIPGLIGAGLLNNGQACLATTRILVSREKHDDLVEALAAAASSMPVGNALDPETQIGPVVAERQRDKIEGLLAAGREEGATAACGGGRPAGVDRGWFIEPTIFGGVENSMRIAREEIFGPVLSVIPYANEEEAIAIANDSPFGLSGAVWGEDTDRAVQIASQIRTGTVGINGGSSLDFRAPFGGFKRSGLGRELGPEGLEAYTEYQSIIHAAG